MQRFEEIKKRKFVKARLSNNSVLFACAAFLLKHLCLIIVKNINKKTLKTAYCSSLHNTIKNKELQLYYWQLYSTIPFKFLKCRECRISSIG